MIINVYHLGHVVDNLPRSLAHVRLDRWRPEKCYDTSAEGMSPKISLSHGLSHVLRAGNEHHLKKKTL